MAFKLLTVQPIGIRSEIASKLGQNSKPFELGTEPKDAALPR